MVNLELTSEEAEQLRFILESYRTDLRGEIHETDSRTFRAQLKEREAVIDQLLQRLPLASEEASA
jgi:hypothetical protein